MKYLSRILPAKKTNLQRYESAIVLLDRLGISYEEIQKADEIAQGALKCFFKECKGVIRQVTANPNISLEEIASLIEDEGGALINAVKYIYIIGKWRNIPFSQFLNLYTHDAALLTSVIGDSITYLTRDKEMTSGPEEERIGLLYAEKDMYTNNVDGYLLGSILFYDAVKTITAGFSTDAPPPVRIDRVIKLYKTRPKILGVILYYADEAAYLMQTIPALSFEGLISLGMKNRYILIDVLEKFNAVEFIMKKDGYNTVSGIINLYIKYGYGFMRNGDIYTANLDDLKLQKKPSVPLNQAVQLDDVKTKVNIVNFSLSNSVMVYDAEAGNNLRALAPPAELQANSIASVLANLGVVLLRNFAAAAVTSTALAAAYTLYQHGSSGISYSNAAQAALGFLCLVAPIISMVDMIVASRSNSLNASGNNRGV